MSMILVEEKTEITAQPGEEMNSPSEEALVNAKVELVIEGESQQQLFVDDSKPGSQVIFGSLVSDFEVFFPNGSPLLDVPNPLKVSQGPSITTTLGPRAIGTFPFQITTSTGFVRDLKLAVSINGPSYKVGFELLDGINMALHAFAKQEAGLPVEVIVKNDSSNSADLLFSGDNSSFREEVAGGGSGGWIFIPEAFGKCGTVRVVNSSTLKGGVTMQSGGTMHADILIEPPP